MTYLRCENLSLNFPLKTLGLKRKGDLRSNRFLYNDRGHPTALRVLKNITFSLDAGDRLALIGQNGAGKSTLLRAMGGVYFPDEGVVDIEGSIRGIYNMQLGIRPESTGWRNLYLSCLIQGIDKATIKTKLPEIGEYTELGEFLSMPVATYSTGMRMRLMFAAATAFDPDILLLDEWIGAGDEKFREKSQKRMEELVSNAGILVLASHHKNLLKSICNKGIWIHDGEIRAYGDVEPLLDDYTAFMRKNNDKSKT